MSAPRGTMFVEPGKTLMALDDYTSFGKKFGNDSDISFKVTYLHFLIFLKNENESYNLKKKKKKDIFTVKESLPNGWYKVETSDNQIGVVPAAMVLVSKKKKKKK